MPTLSELRKKYAKKIELDANSLSETPTPGNADRLRDESKVEIDPSKRFLTKNGLRKEGTGQSKVTPVKSTVKDAHRIKQHQLEIKRSGHALPVDTQGVEETTPVVVKVDVPNVRKKVTKVKKPKFTDEECKVMALMYDSNRSKWENKSKTWKILLSQYYAKNKVYIEKGRKLNEEDLK